MEKGIYLATKIIGKSLDDNTKLEIDLLLEEAKSYSFKEPDFRSEIRELIDRLPEESILALKGYTGLNFKKINAILRNNWNYEELYKKTEEEEQKLREDISMIDEIISSFPPNKNAFITYRGSSVASYKKYGIDSIEELKCLEGKYLYEEGYTSTSLDEKESYYNKEINGTINNIKTVYIIPPYSNDGMPLTSSVLSYSPNQKEYLLGRNCLSKVVDVKIDGNSAIVTAVLIPQKIWNKTVKLDTKEVKK